MPNVAYFRNKIEIQHNGTPLVIKQNNFATKVLNACIIYDLDNWSENPLRNFSLKKCLLRATNIVKSNGKERYVYSGHRIIAFHGKAFNGE